MRYSPRDYSKFCLFKNFESLRVNIYVDLGNVCLPQILPLDDLLHRVFLEALPKYAIGLPTSSLAICKYCGVIAV